MDDAVIAAMQRWPQVPDVHGWLSLDARGTWRLHEGGDAALGTPGRPITNQRIIAFINRNYASADDGSWYFQNGPQRVFVHLAAAPYVIRVAADRSALETHTGQRIEKVDAWFLTTDGSLYAATSLGGAIVLDRHLEDVMQHLFATTGQPLLDVLADMSDSDAAAAPVSCVHPPTIVAPTEAPAAAPPATGGSGHAWLMAGGFNLPLAPVRWVAPGQIPEILRFRRAPYPGSACSGCNQAS